jgi:hypothetical protein
MTRKSFTTYKPEKGEEFDINGHVFNLRPAVPGDVLLDFLAGANAEDPSAMARTIRSLLDSAIVPEQLDEWHTFIRDEENAVNLNLLSEIAGFVSEKLSANPQQQPLSRMTG